MGMATTSQVAPKTEVALLKKKLSAREKRT
jgi:hypothetical protein